MASYYGLGVMSGPSMDGLDLCFAEFTGDSQSDIWGYRIEQAVTVPYSKTLKDRLANAASASGIELIQLQADWSHFVGQCLEKFITSKHIRPDFAASHGHTVCHQPEKSLSFQIGDGEIISSYLGCPIVCNFRSKDIALGGQGAPLVACGERFLFQQTDLSITLGGIAQVGCKGEQACHVCPCTTLLNHLAGVHDSSLEQDQGGELAAQGEVIPEVLAELSKHQTKGPKSLGYEWVRAEVLPILKTNVHSVPDLLRTCIEHICQHVQEECVRTVNKPKATAMVTGGGVYNKTLMGDLKDKLAAKNIRVIDTDDEIVEYKEALVFAFLGLRALLGMENIFSSITGSKADTVSGSIHHGSNSDGIGRLQAKFNFMIRKTSSGVHELRIISDS